MNKMEKALETCIDMLLERGYKYYDENSGIMSDDKNNSIFIFILPTGKLTIDQIKTFIMKAKQYDITHFIVIINDNITPTAKKYIHDIPDMKCELFTCSELQYNLTRHYLVPKHVKLEPRQANYIRKTTNNKLPIMLHTDPISRFYDYSTGDIIRIDRKDGSIIYRIVK